jgi:hypothetical protein
MNVLVSVSDHLLASTVQRDHSLHSSPGVFTPPSPLRFINMHAPPAVHLAKNTRKPPHTRLEEVLAAAAAAGGHRAPMIGHGGEDLELGLEVFAQIHNGGDVAAAVAVVGCGPDRHDVLVFEVVFVAFVDELVRARNELQAVDVVELPCVRGGAVCRVRETVRTSDETLSPNSHPAPRGDTAHVSTSSGSLHTRSQNAPSCGIACARATTRIWSNVRISGLRPPWTQSTLPSTIAANARKSKT